MEKLITGLFKELKTCCQQPVQNHPTYQQLWGWCEQIKGNQQSMNTDSTDFSTALSCPLFPSCSGCSKMGDTTEIEEKTVLANWANEKKIPFLLRSHTPYGYRIRTKLPCRRVKNKIELGLFKRGTHDLVPMPRCPLHTDAINQMIGPLKELFERHRIIPYSEDDQLGELRSVQITDNRKGDLQIALSFFEVRRDLRNFYQDLLALRKNTSLWINHHTNPTSNTIFSDQWEHIGGERDFWIRFGKEEFPFHPGSFLQSNPALFEILLSDLREKISPGSKILDLFSGVGVIGSQFADVAKEVVLIESNPLCKEMFDLFQKKSKHVNLLFRTQGAENLTESMSYDALIVDPPRKGLSKSLKEHLVKSPIEKVIYVSCGLQSLQRDVQNLEEMYELVDLKGYLLFPGTDQIETVAELKRK